MPTYDCTENQFVENIRRLLQARVKFTVNRMVAQRDDGRYSLGHLPDGEFEKYQLIARRANQRSTVYAKKHFLDELRRRIRSEGEILHSLSSRSRPILSIPYFKVTYTFTVWAETYRFEFDALFTPEIRLEKLVMDPTSPRGKVVSVRRPSRSKPSLVYVMRFQMPQEESLKIPLPPSVILFDVRHVYRY